MTNATVNELKNAIAETDTSKTVKTRKTTTRRAKTDPSDKKQLVKTTNKKIENAEKLTQAEVQALQETATDRYKSFADSFKELANKNDDIEYIRDSNRDTYFKIDKLESHISRKEHKIVLYTTTCRDTEERNKVLSKFKDTKSVKKCDRKQYIDSKEKRCEIIFTDVNTIQCEESFINTLIKTVRHCQKLREEFRKEQKKAE